MNNWKTGYPPDSKPVLAVTIADVAGSLEKRRTIIRAQYLRHKEMESDSDDESVEWYNEEDDCYYMKAGWYEVTDYNLDYWYFTVDDPVIAWMPMPELPA